MTREPAVSLRVRLVEHEVDEVEPREQRGRELDVVHHRHSRVVPAAHGVSGREHGRPRVQHRDDTSLGDGYRLLLHHLVQRGPRAVAHLVELVDATDTAVRQHQRAALQHEILRLRVPLHVRGESDG